jgi:LuxR family maltose regulon positive regulatory protein
MEVEPCLGDLRDEQVLAEHQPAAIVGALAHALLGNSSEVEWWVAAVQRAHVEGPLPDGTRTSSTWAVLLRATLCWDGVERMGDDALYALDRLGKHSPMFALAQLLLGVSQLLDGRPDEAELTLEEASELAASADAPVVASVALAELSLLAQADERWGLAEELGRRARDLAREFDHSGHTAAALAYVASARSALRNNNWVRAADDIDRVHALLPRLTDALPWLAVQVRLELARAHLTLNDMGAADELSTEIETLLLARPYLGTLKTAARELGDAVLSLHGQPAANVRSLTAAELRLLPLLTTHLTFRQIAQRLYVSRNTIKTQAISVYRKLGASSRTEAIDRAIELGLLRPEGKSIERSA